VKEVLRPRGIPRPHRQASAEHAGVCPRSGCPAPVAEARPTVSHEAIPDGGVLTSASIGMGPARTGMAPPATTRSLGSHTSHVYIGCFLLLGSIRPLHVPVYITESPYAEQ